MIASLALLQFPEFGSGEVPDAAGLIRWSGVLASILVVVGGWLFLQLVRGIVDRMSESFAQWRLVLGKVRALLQFFVYLSTVVLVVLLSFRLTDTVLTFLGGSVALAAGFAFKDLAASLVGGITIMIDRPFQVGDRVNFGGYYGEVTSIGLRSVRMQTLDDDTVTIPNSKFIADATSTGNSGALDMMVVVEFHVGIDQDVRRAADLVREVAVTSRYVYLAKPVTVVVAQEVIGSALGVRLALKAYVLDVQYEKAMETDLTLRVLEAFAREGIRPPAVVHRDACAPEQESPERGAR